MSKNETRSSAGDPDASGDPTVDASGSMLTDDSTLSGAGASELPVDSFEGYQVLREIHRGGQGVVYEAIQKSTKRKVAIKVLLEGRYASKSAKRRFEREIELVAQLKHPNIISIFHSGLTDDGRPFYVMDYVRGVPLHRHAREKKLPLEDTLRLFSMVCEAVQFAHQRGVIHRDLKPSNVIVDVDGRPKVLDFGLAKWMAAPADTLATLSQNVVGTLPYMSPEQTRGNPDEIDTRTDVYALGVILYELLTGHYPYPVAGQMAEVLKHIAETPPTPPTRNWSSDAGVTQRSARRLRPGQCPIDDEVQTIVLRALAKERERRYQSVGELAADIGHYLAGEPIEAKRDSGWYVLKKSLRRYKVPAAIIIAFTVVVTVGFAVTLSFWRSAEQQRKTAEESRLAAEEALERALAAELMTRRGHQRLVSLASMLAHPDSRVSQWMASNPTARKHFLDWFVAAFEETAREAPRDPTVETVLSRLQSELKRVNAELENGPTPNALGVAQYRAGSYEEALETLTRSDELNLKRFNGEHPADVAFIAMSLQQLGRTQEAEAALERLGALMQQDRWANDEESRSFQREAEELITGSTPRAASRPAQEGE